MSSRDLESNTILEMSTSPKVIYSFWTTRIASPWKSRMNLSCGGFHYNAYGLQRPRYLILKHLS